MTTVDPTDAPSAPASDTLAILGLGLIGGSLMRAASAAGWRVYGYNRSAETVSSALDEGFDAGADLADVVERAAADDALIVLATPVTALDEVIPVVHGQAPDCAVTDVISVKQQVARAMARHAPGQRYVGGHPMAGTAQSGWAAGQTDLFTRAVWAIATDDSADPATWARVARLALDVGSDVIPVASDEHDRAVAAISHLPHLTAAVTAAVGAGDGDLALHLAAGSFRDGTRVAATAPELQRAMLEANRMALLNSLSETIDRLVAARDELRDRGNVETLINDGHRARLRWEELSAAQPRPISGVQIGSPGWQAQLRAQALDGRVWTGQQTA